MTKKLLAILLLCLIILNMLSSCVVINVEKTDKEEKPSTKATEPTEQTEPTEPTIKAPDLVGHSFSEGIMLDGVPWGLICSSKQYSDEYEKGVIIEQSPAAGEKVEDYTIYVVVSLGPEPPKKVMEDLSHVPLVLAVSFLEEMDLNLECLIRYENSSTVEKDCVIRTNPMEAELLQEGQTVTLWISTGP